MNDYSKRSTENLLTIISAGMVALRRSSVGNDPVRSATIQAAREAALVLEGRCATGTVRTLFPELFEA